MPGAMLQAAACTSVSIGNIFKRCNTRQEKNKKEANNAWIRKWICPKGEIGYVPCFIENNYNREAIKRHSNRYD